MACLCCLSAACMPPSTHTHTHCCFSTICGLPGCRCPPPAGLSAHSFSATCRPPGSPVPPPVTSVLPPAASPIACASRLLFTSPSCLTGPLLCRAFQVGLHWSKGFPVSSLLSCVATRAGGGHSGSSLPFSVAVSPPPLFPALSCLAVLQSWLSRSLLPTASTCSRSFAVLLLAGVFLLALISSFPLSFLSSLSIFLLLFPPFSSLSPSTFLFS